MLSVDKKFIFIHIPKTAGVTIYEILSKYTEARFKPPVNRLGWNHENLQQISTALHKDYNVDASSLFKFTFVRNPWDRILSLYHFYNNQTKDHPFYSADKPQVDYIHDNHISFLDFCKHVANDEEIFARKPHVKPYIDYYMLPEYNYDFVGRVETLQQDFNTICDKIGIPKQKLPHKNKTKHKHYTEYYDDETRAIVAEKYAKDIEYFEYGFEK